MHFSTQFEPTRHVVYRVIRSSHTNSWVNPIAALSLQDLCLQILRTTLQRTRENIVSTVYSCCNKPNEASNKNRKLPVMRLLAALDVVYKRNSQLHVSSLPKQKVFVRPLVFMENQWPHFKA